MHSSFHRAGPVAVIAAALLAFGSGVAQAAPQALALVATKGGVGLKCQGGECGAEFSSFCLQSDRFSPAQGTEYRLADVGEVRVLGTTRDGREITLDPRIHLRFESIRSHMAMRISTALDTTSHLDLAKVEVDVGEHVSLLPVPVPEDPNPITESDIAVLTGALRPLGSRMVDANEAHMQAATITNRMINLLPPHGEDAGNALWQRAIGKGRMSSDAKRMSRKAYEFCKFAADRLRSTSLRRCLQTEHDNFIRFLNGEYWDAVGTGI